MLKRRKKAIDDKLDDLSNVISNFKLSDADKKYVEEKGMSIIRLEALDFIKRRVASGTIFNDGTQTPYEGHPVFVAQHATGTCCRACLYKYHGIFNGKRLLRSEIDYLIDLIMTWIQREMDK